MRNADYEQESDQPTVPTRYRHFGRILKGPNCAKLEAIIFVLIKILEKLNTFIERGCTYISVNIVYVRILQ